MSFKPPFLKRYSHFHRKKNVKLNYFGIYPFYIFLLGLLLKYYIEITLILNSQEVGIDILNLWIRKLRLQGLE